LACLVVLALATQASAQSSWSYGQHSGATPAGECFAAFYWPGAGHIAISTHIHYNDTGEDQWFWNEGYDYVDTGTSAPFDINKVPYQYSVDCETDDYSDGGGGWDFIGWNYVIYYVTHTVAATRFDFNNSISPNTDACNVEAFPSIVATAIYNQTCGGGQQYLIFPKAPPIELNSQAVQNSTFSTALTCVSTTPASYFTEYVWRSYFLVVIVRTDTWIAWWDGTCFAEHT
jgi:hypothetical protein